MLQYRTDLAMEAHELLCAQSGAAIPGAECRTVFRRGCSVTSVHIETEGAAQQLGKPCGRISRSTSRRCKKTAESCLRAPRAPSRRNSGCCSASIRAACLSRGSATRA